MLFRHSTFSIDTLYGHLASVVVVVVVVVGTKAVAVVVVGTNVLSCAPILARLASSDGRTDG